MARHHAVTHVRQLQRGDHVRVFRIGYQHHAIYVGSGQLVEFGGGVGGGPVAHVTLEDFARRDRAEIVEHDDALPREDVAVRAEQQIGRDGFALWSNNCEHFASWCATGRGHSEQVEQVKAVAAAAVVGVGVGVAIAALTENGQQRRDRSVRA